MNRLRSLATWALLASVLGIGPSLCKDRVATFKLDVREISLGEFPQRAFLLQASPDSQHIAYVAVRGGRASVVVDGVAHEAFDRLLHPVSFSPDGSHVAYVALRGGKAHAVVDGVAGRPYDNIQALTFSAEGGHVAYVATSRPQGLASADGADLAALRPRRFVVVDGVEGAHYDTVGEPVLSHDGARVAYAAHRGAHSFVVVDAVGGRQYDGIAGGSIRFSPDGSRVGYVALRRANGGVMRSGRAGRSGRGGGRSAPGGIPPMGPVPPGMYGALGYAGGGSWLVVVDGVESPAHHAVSQPLFSPRGERVAYVTARPASGGDGSSLRWSVVVDGVREEEHDQIQLETVTFSPDGRRLAYCAQDGEKWAVVVDGTPGERYDRIETQHGGILFSPDGEHVAYRATRRGKAVVVIDGLEQEEAGEHVVFSPDSRKTARAIGRDGRWVIAVRGDEEAEHDGGVRWVDELVFSPDSRHVAYRTQHGGKPVVMVDGVVAGEYDRFVQGSRLVFDEPDQVRIVAQRGRQIVSVSIRITQQ